MAQATGKLPDRWRRHVAFVSFSFVNTATVTVLPQHHFWRDPSGDAWTTACLLVSAVSALAGIWVSARAPWRQHAGWLTGGMGVVFAATLGLAALDLVMPHGLYLVLMALLSMVSSALMQRYDERSVALAGQEGRVANDLGISLMRFMGMLCAPAFSSVAQPGSALFLGLSAGLAVLVAVSGSALGACKALTDRAETLATAAAAATAQPAPQPAASPARDPLRGPERGLWLAGLLTYANFCVLASAAPFLLRDLQGLSQAIERAWWLIALVYASAMLGNVQVQRGGWMPRLAWLWGAPVVVLAVAAGAGASSAAWPVVQGLACGALGVSFSVFLMGLRNHATRQATWHGRPGWLARYNQLPRWATLLAFSVMAAMAALGQGLDWPMARGVTLYLGLTSLAVLLSAPWWMRCEALGTSLDSK